MNSRKTRKHKSASRKSPRGSFAKRSFIKSAGQIEIHTMGGDAFKFPSGTDIEEITRNLYPDTKSYMIPKLVFVDSKQNGYEQGQLKKGVYSLVKIAKKPLPTRTRT